MILSLNNIKKVLNELDPDRIYVENIRSILGTNTRIATFICNLAVRKGFFEKYYGIVCKNDSCSRILKSYNSLQDIPKEITCELCEDDKKVESTFKTSELDIIPFFKYVKNSYRFSETDLVQ